MISYWATLSARFRTLLQYRAAALAGMGTQLFWGLVRVMIFEAFFRSTIAEQPMSADDSRHSPVPGADGYAVQVVPGAYFGI